MASKLSAVIIDGDPNVLRLLSLALAGKDLQVFTAADPEQGLAFVFSERPQVVIVESGPSGVAGLEILDRITAFDPVIDVILLVAFRNSYRFVVEAIRRGAADCLSKPVKVSLLQTRVIKLLNDARRQTNSYFADAESQVPGYVGMIGQSYSLMKLTTSINRVAPYYRTALITGETGTGKELAARALHNQSPVAAGPFVVLNCSAIVDVLFESELFGHARGAFTDAIRDKPGLFEFANQGTLFLDEIGDMPPHTQAKLLRTLQSREIMRVGSLTPLKVDVRVIAGTHHDLRRAIGEKRFREDLYYRLAMTEISVPSLAARKDDLPLLTAHFLGNFARQFRKEIRGLTLRAEMMLARHHWPGNIRELENVLGHGCMMAEGDTLDIGDLPAYLDSASQIRLPITPIRSVPGTPLSLEAHEKQLIANALAQANGNQSAAAAVLGIGRDALRYKMKKHNLEATIFARAAAG